MTNAAALRLKTLEALQSIDQLVSLFQNNPVNLKEYKDRSAGDWFGTIRNLPTGQGLLRCESVVRSGMKSNLYAVGFRFVFKSGIEPFDVYDAFTDGLPSLSSLKPDLPLPMQEVIPGYHPMSWPLLNPGSLAEPAIDFWEIVFEMQRKGAGR